MELFIVLLGLFMIYSTIHFVIMSFTKTYKDRTAYEKVISICAIVAITMVYLGTAY